jgi:hypothetical protein
MSGRELWERLLPLHPAVGSEVVSDAMPRTTGFAAPSRPQRVHCVPSRPPARWGHFAASALGHVAVRALSFRKDKLLRKIAR